MKTAADRRMPRSRTCSYGTKVPRVASVAHGIEHDACLLQLLGETHELGDGPHAHLLHDACAMRLHRALGGMQRIADLLVEAPGDDTRHHLALARREARIAASHVGHLGVPARALEVALERPADHLEQ